MRRSLPSLLTAWLLPAAVSLAGPYSASREDGLNPHDPGVPAYIGPDGNGIVSAANRPNPHFVAWAARVVSYQPAPGVDPGFDNPAAALGPATGDQFDIVSLGDLTAGMLASNVPPGMITLGFDVAAFNAPGPDLAVFENAFGGFIEVAFVEVSSDGTVFARFPSRALGADPVGPFTELDPTDLYNLAGKHQNNDSDAWGTPFDLDDLTNHARVVSGEVDLNNIRYVRIVDIPGSGDVTDADDPAHPIYDPWPTIGSGGFDLEAVGILNPRAELHLAVSGPDPLLSWLALTNREYQVEFQDPGGVWTDLGAAVPGSNQPVSRMDTTATGDHRRYRLRLEVSP